MKFWGYNGNSLTLIISAVNSILRGDKLQPAYQVVDWSENDLFVNTFLLAKASEFSDFLELTQRLISNFFTLERPRMQG